EASVHRALGDNYLCSRRLTEAEYELRRATSLGETGVFQDLGVVFMEEEKYPEAVASFLQALTLAPDRLLCRMNLGTAYRLMNRNMESEQAYRRALELAEKEI